MTVSDIKEYVQVRTPDKAALANCVIRAKGPERTMAQFADDCQVSASTLSRIVNSKITNPLSVELIVKIFENRATQEDDFLLEALAHANGLHSKDYANRVNSRNSPAHRRNEEISRANMMKNIIVSEIVDQGLPIKKILDSRVIRPDSEAPSIYPRRRIDFSLALDEDELHSSTNMWAFFLYPYVPSQETDHTMMSDRKYIVNNLLDKVSRWFLMDAWYPKSLANMKTSFTFVDQELFYSFSAALQNASLNSEMTVLLIDMESYRVVNEVWLPGEYNRLTETSIFGKSSHHLFDPTDCFGDFDENDEF